MNYSTKIQKMLESGVITKEHADKLSKTLESNKENIIEVDKNSKKKTIYDMILYGLFAVVSISFFYFMPEQSTVVVDVSTNLNDASKLGSVSSKYTLFFTILLFISILYSIFYFLTIFSFNRLVRYEQNILMSLADLKNVNIYESEIKQLDIQDKELVKVSAYKNEIREYITTLINKYESSKEKFPSSLGASLKKFQTFKGVENE